MKSHNRILQFDFVRSICMLYIVGIWHFNNYLNPIYRFSGDLAECLECVTISVLATFTFISGYMLRRYEFSTCGDALTFYKKRLLRIYPLFVLSAISLCLIRFADFSQVFYGAIGLALFTSDPIKTLWFISMLIFLYALTPLIRSNRIIRSKYQVLMSFLLVFFILLMLYICDIIDVRLLLYAPIYIIGLHIKDLKLSKKEWLLLIVLAVGAFLLTIYCGADGLFRMFCSAYLGTIIILALAFVLPINNLRKPIGFIAYLSMSMYLFHRQIFGVTLILFGVKNQESAYLPMLLALLALFISLCVTYMIQWLYDRIQIRIQNK